jgi:DNA-binding MarR family transcriptional regulator
MKKTDPPVPQQLIVSQSSQLVRRSTKILEKKLSPRGITFQEFRIVGLLIDDEDITQKGLAEKLSVRPATLSVAISKLESRGVVRRQPSSIDKRVNYLRLIPNNNISEMIDVLSSFEKDISEGVSAKDLQTTRKVLGQLLANISKQEQ